MMNFGDPLMDALTRKEPLHADLEQYVRKGTVLGEMVHSPLVVSPLSMGRDRCGHVNTMYVNKLAILNEAIAERNWSRAIMIHERPYRFDALTEMLEKGLEQGSPDFWSAVGQVWVDSENIHESFEAWREVWRSNPEHRHHVMSVEDREGFSALRKRFPVYRGFSWRGTKLGMSWTLSRKKAVWFAQRFDEQGSGHVITTEVAKDDVLAYFGGRNEQEIVIDPDVIGKKWDYVDI